MPTPGILGFAQSRSLAGTMTAVLRGILFGFLLSAMAAAWAEPFDSPPESPHTGSLDGRLTDRYSVPLRQAVVVVRNLATGETVRGITGKNGGYRFTGLGPGEYRLEADVPRLGKGAVEGILVSAGHATRVQAALVMELPSQSPLSETDMHELDPVSPAVTTMIAAEELTAVPVSSRNWQEFAALTPAANPSPQGAGRNGGQIGDASSGGEEEDSSELSVSFDGGDASQTAKSIDGMETTPSFRPGGGASARQGESIAASAVLSLEARLGDSPAGGPSTSGGSIVVTTSHGNNGLHGQVFYLNRQGFWAARNPFTQWIKETATATGINVAQFTGEPYSADDDRQTFGLGIGGKLKRRKIFWFMALDGLRRNDPGVATVRHSADFFARPNNNELAVLAARLELPGPALTEEAIAAYSGALEQMAGLLGPVPRTSNQVQGFGRADWQMTERQHVSVEANAANLDAPAGALSRSSETYGSHSFGNSHASEIWEMDRLESFLTPNLLNAAGVEYRWYVQSDTPQAPSTLESPLMANSWGQLPEIVADSKYGFVLGKPAWLGKSRYPDERSLVAQDTVSWVHGAHLVKVGGSFGHLSDAVHTLVNQTGTYSYADVLNFISDQNSFLKYGFAGEGSANSTEHNCDATGRVYVKGGSEDHLGGLGFLPCYAWYTQRIGPADWHLSTNSIAAFATEQWQPWRRLTISAGVRLETEQLPPAIALANNPELPATQKLPAASLNWGPRVGLAWSPWDKTVLRAGAGLYFGRIDQSSILAALTQTGAAAGDLNFFFKPTDAGAPPFPYVFSEDPQTAVTPGAVWFASRFKPREVDQAVFSIEQEFPGHWLVSVSGLASLGRRLPISVDTNLDPEALPQTITYDVVDALREGPIKTPKITVPFYTGRLNSNYQQLSSIESRANSTYDAAMFKISRYGHHGLGLRAHYLYAHATDWNPNESGNVAVNDLLDPQDFRLEYGTSNLDIRHSAGITVLYETPWKLRGWEGALANAWSVAGVGQYRSGLPFTMRTSGYIPGYFDDTGRLIEGVGPGMNGSAGDNRVYGVGRNTYRYPAAYTGDARLAKRFNLPRSRELELLAESFNLFNHQNVTLIETTGYIINRGTSIGSPPTFRFLTGLKAGTVEFGKPLDVNATNFYRQRQIQLGVRARF